MNELKQKIEILAPAGSKESLIAAIAAGADAVYIGGSRFGARAFADNLDGIQMLEAIDYAHLYDRRLYLTVNTLLREEELREELYLYLRPFYEQGLDAVIVQDVGVMEFIHREFPKLAIHASTQMTLTMAEGAMNFLNYGVTRLVNARELSLEEIKRIRSTTTLEMEAFVHGALCYCYSGQCLMSSMLGGRSGNRGRCAQPCRMEYHMKQESSEAAGGQYLLSPKDMCTLDMVPELIHAGIDSFKIEGRMKRYEYTAGVTAAYRREVDRYLELGEEEYRKFHELHPEEMKRGIRRLQDLYNRGGFSSGYYKQRNGTEMMSMERPNHSGVLVGRVKSVYRNRAVLEIEEELYPQDLLEIRRKAGESYEYTLKDGHQPGKELEANFTPGLPIHAGDPVYRTKNQSLLSELSREYFETVPKIEIFGEFDAVPEQPMQLKLKAGKCEVSVLGECAETAQKQPMTEKKLRIQLEKTGDTPFRFQNLEIRIAGDIFIPVSKLNELRRKALRELEAAIKQSGHRQSVSAFENKYAADNQEMRETDGAAGREKGNPLLSIIPGSRSVSVMTAEQLEQVLLLSQIDRIYYDISALPLERAAAAALRTKEAGKKFLLRLPQICRAETYDWLYEHREELLGEGIDGYLIRNYEELYLICVCFEEETREKERIADAMLYTMNTEAKRFFYKQGLTGLTAPLEQNRQELSGLGMEDMEFTVYGRQQLMTSAQCVRKHTAGCLREGALLLNQPIVLVDRKEKEFPTMNFCGFCYSSIYNAEVLSLLDCMKEVEELKPLAVRYDFTFESGEEVKQILTQGELIRGSAYTRGHFHRGVQ